MAEFTNQFKRTAGLANTTAYTVDWTVPTGVTVVTMELWGAAVYPSMTAGFSNGTPVEGVSTESGSGSYSNIPYVNHVTRGYVKGDLSVTPGDVYHVNVGGYGDTATGTTSAGWNGGGQCVAGSPTSSGIANGAQGTGGGGATDVRTGGTALANRIAVAGGSGGRGAGVAQLHGSSSAMSSSPNPPFYGYAIMLDFALSGLSPIKTWATGNGRGWGGYAAQTGGLATTLDTSANIGFNADTGGTVASSGGGGATVSAGGAAGTNQSTITMTAVAAQAGSSGQGGNGGSWTAFTAVINSLTFNPIQGGGGGGGYFGGGGGGCGMSVHDSLNGNFGVGGGGGGGSNFLSGSFSNTTNINNSLGPDAYAIVDTGFYPGGTSPLSKYYNDPRLTKDVLNGMAQFTYTIPPNAPTNVTPSNGGDFNASADLVIAYKYTSNATGTDAPQASYDFEYKLTTSGSYTSISHALAGTTNSENFSFTVPGGTMSDGNVYDVRLRVTDLGGDTSAYFSWQLIAIAPIGAPGITSPVAAHEYTNATFTVTWTVDSGVHELNYVIRIVDDNGNNVILENGQPSSRMNLCPNPSFETDTTNWATSAGTLSRSTTTHKLGSATGKIIWPASASATVQCSFPTVVGETYVCSMWVAGDGTNTVTPQLNITDSSGNPTASGGTFAGSSTTYALVKVSFVATDSKHFLDFVGTGNSGGTAFNYFDCVLIEAGATDKNSLNSGFAYFDGGTANGQTGTAAWKGTSNDSISTLEITNVLTKSESPSIAYATGLRLFIKYSTVESLGVYSLETERDFFINFNPPVAPSVTLTTDDDSGSATLAITYNYTSPVVVPTLVEIYRANVSDDEDEIRIASFSPHIGGGGVPDADTYVDYLLQTETEYAYRVRTFAGSGSYVDVT